MAGGGLLTLQRTRKSRGELKTWTRSSCSTSLDEPDEKDACERKRRYQNGSFLMRQHATIKSEY